MQGVPIIVVRFKWAGERKTGSPYKGMISILSPTVEQAIKDVRALVKGEIIIVSAGFDNA